MIRRALIFFSFLVGANTLFGQSDSWSNKHFLDIGYGVGKSNWYSYLNNSDLYDKKGSIIKSGDLQLKAQNNISLLHADVSFPLSKIRIGFGISFTQLYIDKLVVKSNNNDPINVVFDESLTFNKLYVAFEVPLNSEIKRFAVNIKSNIGYFNYSGIQTLDFFGEDANAKTIFANVGLNCNLKLYPRLFLFVYPNIDYMQLKNTNYKSGDITHRIVTGGITGGLRIDLSDN